MCYSYYKPFECHTCGEIFPYCQCGNTCELCGEVITSKVNKNGTCENCEDDFDTCLECGETHLNVDFIDGVCCICYDTLSISH